MSAIREDGAPFVGYDYKEIPVDGESAARVRSGPSMEM